MKNQLESLRRKIDEIDGGMVNLLAKRMKIVRRIGEYKKKNNIPALQKDRFNRVLESKVNQGKKLGLNPALIEKIYHAIHEAALKIEKSL